MAEGLDITAIVAAVISAGVSFYSLQKARKLEEFKHQLAIEKDEKASLRDYKFEARKRLYRECEPILFRFAELSEGALFRIQALATNAKKGNLGPQRYYLSHEHYFIRSTIYRLLAPLTAFQLLQRKLTSVDLSLSPNINIQYQLAKILYYTFSSANDLAETEPAIPYDREQIGEESKQLNENEKSENRIKCPEKYWVQGLRVGEIDNSVDKLIEYKNSDNNFYIKSFGEFEKEFFKQESWQNLFKKEQLVSDKNNHPFKLFFILFSAEKGFHPKTRPVLWRILLMQAYIYQAIINIRKDDKVKITDFHKFIEISNIDYKKFDWRQPQDNISDEKLNESFKAVENYLQQKLKVVFDISSKIKDNKKENNTLSSQEIN